MKKLTTIISLLIIMFSAQSQTVEFYDGFEAGNYWNYTGAWGLTTASFMGTYAMTESPVGNYADQTTSYAVMDTSVDLTTAQDAMVEFTATYSIEYGFDYNFFDVSGDGGVTWINIASFNGDSAWWRYSYSLGGFVGNSDVKCRFRFVTDALLNFDGMIIDEFQITSYGDDISPPLIVHTPLPHYEGSLYNHQIIAEIFDISGVGTAILNYTVDNVVQPAITGVNYNGNSWLFEMPAQPPGAWIDYNIWAIDNSVNTNFIYSNTYEIIAGNYIKYDNGIVDFIGNIGVGYSTSAAVRIDIGGTTNLVSGLIRNYTDPFNLNSDMLFHVWSDSAGMPGHDLVIPFTVTPAATQGQPHKMTRIDLRPYADSLTGIADTVFVGFTCPGGVVHLVQTTPSIGNHTYTEFFGNWSASNDDFHFRAITSEITGAPVASFSFDTLTDPLVSFTDLSSGTPTSWYWDFDDNGVFSTDQNPQHAFSLNGTYNVCLTAENGVTSNTSCQMVTVSNVMEPIAGFYYITDWAPEILFVDTSMGYPTSWFWDFDDNGATWGYLNPSYTFSQNGTYNVCLIVENALSSDTICQQIVIDDYVAPETSFSYDLSMSPWIQFYDESSSMIYNSPDQWLWDFGNSGDISVLENPLYLFPANGVYTVCLTSSNTYGNDMYCGQVIIDTYLAPVADFSIDTSNIPVVHFYDESTDSLINSPTQWLWDFGDGTSSTQQNPIHNYLENDTFIVCLIASNAAGNDTICYEVIVDIYDFPQAAFLFDNVSDPVVFFQDVSGGVPTTWYWVFDDNGAVSNVPNPAITFSTNDTFNVCLTVSNYLGNDTYCTDVIINTYMPPVTEFTYTIEEDSIVHFNDNSVNDPSEWLWEFDFNTETSTLQNPDFIYSQNGIYHVCLTTSNIIGPGDTYCEDIEIILAGIDDVKEVNMLQIFPQPLVNSSIIEHSYISKTENVSISLYDMLGKRIPIRFIKDGTKIILYRNNLKSGMYIIELATPNGLVNGKLLVQ